MKPQTRARPETTPATPALPTVNVPHDPRLNAVKHGLRSAALLLPGEDAAEFQRQRFDLFQSYQPRTQEEARAVEDMIFCEWRMARCRRWEEAIDPRLTAMWCGGTGGEQPATEQHCESDPHRWMHHSMDCNLKEKRLERLMKCAKARLMELQKQRRNNLIVGAMDVMTDWQDLERQGAARLGLVEEPGEPEAAPSVAPAAERVDERLVSCN